MANNPPPPHDNTPSTRVFYCQTDDSLKCLKLWVLGGIRLPVLYLSIWIDSKPIVWYTSLVFTDDSDKIALSLIG